MVKKCTWGVDRSFLATGDLSRSSQLSHVLRIQNHTNASPAVRWVPWFRSTISSHSTQHRAHSLRSQGFVGWLIGPTGISGGKSRILLSPASPSLLEGGGFTVLNFFFFFPQYSWFGVTFWSIYRSVLQKWDVSSAQAIFSTPHSARRERRPPGLQTEKFMATGTRFKLEKKST